MKIAYLLNTFPVLSETFIVREISVLQKNGFELSIFSRHSSEGSFRGSIVHEEARQMSKDTCYYKSLRMGISKYRLGLLHLVYFILNPVRYMRTFLFSALSGLKSFRLFRSVILFVHEFQNTDVEHIHAHFALDACTIAMMSSMMTGISYSFTIHAHDIFIPDLAKHLEHKFNKAKFVACISKYNKHYILKKYPKIDADKIKIVHCGIDTGSIVPAIKKKNELYTICSVGRLHAQKGYKYLIKACSKLKNKDSLPFVCKIIGEGEERTELEKMILKADLLENVLLLGAKEQKEVIRHVKTADLFVLPCVQDEKGFMDGIPVSLMEAMALSVPVISTTVSGIPELIKDGAGFLVKPKKSVELANAIAAVYNLSEKEKDHMGTTGRLIIENEFNLAHEVEKLSEYFNA